ncbi:hypothetical protein ZHAS_00005657 [Anopheles sinensis]|uniref:Uncharacterized protein n=1 Tax=Anopheles sinensis TaxID=74873 RepID=A0A084VK16_ANOSI|nr:hypothetical protein ZHAS_00005657 [Anopheles sinensis]
MYRRHASKNTTKKLKPTKSAQLTSTPDCQLDATVHHQTHDPNGIQTPLVDSGGGGGGGGLGGSGGIGGGFGGPLGRRGSPTMIGEPPDGDETDPDVIPNQYERRPPKTTLPTPLFRSPSARLIQRNGGEHLLHEDERHCDGSSLASLTGSHTESYATLGRANNSSVTSTLSPLSQQPSTATLPLPSLPSMSVTSVGAVGSLLSSPASQSSGLVTSTLNEYRFRPEVVTTSNRIQESCI